MLIMDYATNKMFPARVLFGWLENYRAARGLTQRDMAEMLEWKPQFYSGLARKKSVFSATVFHAAKKLKIDPAEILLLAEDSEMLVMPILKRYPKEVIFWMTSEEGREAIVKIYTKKLIKKMKKDIKGRVRSVAQGLLNTT